MIPGNSIKAVRGAGPMMGHGIAAMDFVNLSRMTKPCWDTQRSISGTTLDSNGAALANCTVNLFNARTRTFVMSTVSDGSGNYVFDGVSADSTYFIEAYLAGSPDQTGATVNTLAGV